MVMSTLTISTPHPIEKFHPLFKKSYQLQNKRGYVACCPAHNDKTPSLSYWEDGPDRVGICCYAGCSQDAILEALNLTWEDLYRDRKKKPTPVDGISIYDLSQDKLILPHLFDKLNITTIAHNGKKAVRIPYYTSDGKEYTKVRIRKELSAKKGSIWNGEGDLIPYGLERLEEARKAGYVVIVEGESDCWTLWQRGIPALGIPGATQYRGLFLSYLEGIEHIYLSQEADATGCKFPGEVHAHLVTQGFSGKASIIDWAKYGVNDVNELHRKNPKHFKKAFEQAMKQALNLRPDGSVEKALPPAFQGIPEAFQHALLANDKSAIYELAGEYVSLPDRIQRLIDVAMKDHTASFPMREFQALVGSIRKEQEQKRHDHEALDAVDLLRKDIPEVKWLIRDLMPEGLHILAGNKKIGKSWFDLQLCLSILFGGVFMGSIPVEQQGEAMYLALEDNERRLKSRLEKQLIGRPVPRGLHLFFQYPRLDTYGIAKMETFIKEHPRLKLIIIDPWVKVKPLIKLRPGETCYDGDYSALEEIKRLADTYAITIIIQTHTRKQEASDIIDEVNGSSGLAGSCDSTYVLKRARGEREGTLWGTGRDFNEFEYALGFSDEFCVWEMLGDAKLYRMSSERKEIIDLLQQEGELAPKDIASLLNRKANNIRYLLSQMVKEGQILKTEAGKYMSCEWDETAKSPHSANSANAPHTPHSTNDVQGEEFVEDYREEEKQEQIQGQSVVLVPLGVLGDSVISDSVSDQAQMWKRRIQAYGEARGFPSVRLSDGYTILATEIAWQDFLKYQSQKWQGAYEDIRNRRI